MPVAQCASSSRVAGVTLCIDTVHIR
uniref:Uncharacterized protein n=1 Tax=Anguilla anguilla TaxID=7936 RepID=A0A0E9T7S4_ANGAN